jgi:protein-S-isoprenylcysteine O-methyltransferase Ste14
MTLFWAFLTLVSAIWIGFEVWLFIRDRTQGKGKTDKDRGTVYYNLIAITGGITLASVFNGYRMFFFPGGRSATGFWIGVCIMLLGFGLRIWAVVTLGGSFRTTVETHIKQLVVKTGPYRLVRHPSYSGLLLMCIGFGIAVQNLLSLAIALVLPLVALLYRIHVEEKALVLAIGSAYKEYQGETKKLIPWLW